MRPYRARVASASGHPRLDTLATTLEAAGCLDDCQRLAARASNASTANGCSYRSFGKVGIPLSIGVTVSGNASSPVLAAAPLAKRGIW